MVARVCAISFQVTEKLRASVNKATEFFFNGHGERAESAHMHMRTCAKLLYF